MRGSRALGTVALGIWMAAGCSTPPSGGDGATAEDAGAAQADGGTAGDAGVARTDGGIAPDDAAAMPRDAASAPDDAGWVPGDAGWMPRDAAWILVDAGSSPDDIARCEATAATVAAACHGQVDRTCEHTEAARWCAHERADVLADAYECLAAFSSSSCRTFSDPSGAEVCLSGVAAEHDVTHARAVADTIVARCPTILPERLVTTAILPLMVFSDATLDALDACFAGAADCDATLACYRSELANIVACYP